MQRPGFKAAWEGLEEEYAALDELLQARKQAGLTQEQVAARMGTTKSAVSRLEASLRSENHSPSFATLRKYAHACRQASSDQDDLSPRQHPYPEAQQLVLGGQSGAPVVPFATPARSNPQRPVQHGQPDVHTMIVLGAAGKDDLPPLAMMDKAFAAD